MFKKELKRILLSSGLPIKFQSIRHAQLDWASFAKEFKAHFYYNKQQIPHQVRDDDIRSQSLRQSQLDYTTRAKRQKANLISSVG